MMGVRRVGWVATAVMVGVSLVPLWGQPGQMGGLGLTVYEDIQFRGENATFRDNEPDLRRARFANRISSLQVAPGEVWEVCAGVNYIPPCQVFAGAEPDLGHRSWNDRIASARRVRGGATPLLKPVPARRALILYSDERFGGESRTIGGFASSLGSFNDRAKSVRILSGRWELCEEDGYRKCRTVDSDASSLASLGLSSRVSSVRPAAGGGGDPRPGNVPPERPRLTLFDRDRYRGDARTFQEDAVALGGFGNRSQSARVTGTWQLCDAANFKGRCVTVSQDVPSLATYGMHSRVSSARPLPGARPEGGPRR